MNLKLLPILALLFLPMLLLMPLASALPWSISINPVSGQFEIRQGERQSITVTGPEDSQIFVEIVNASNAELLVQFPTSGVITLTGGLAIIFWDIPNGFPLGSYYAQLRDASGSTRAALSFRVLPLAEGDQDLRTLEEQIAQMEESLIRLDRWRGFFEKDNDAFIASMNEQLQTFFILLLALTAMTVFVAMGTFAGRNPKLQALFWGTTGEKEDSGNAELEELIQMFVQREIPKKFHAVFEDKSSQKSEPKPESETPEKPEKPKKLNKKERRKGGFYTKTCEFCGDEFKTKVATAKYCPDKTCRVNAFRARKAEKERGD